MSEKNSKINEEIEVNLKLKVKFTEVAYSDQLSPEELHETIQAAKSKINDELINMVSDEFFLQPLVPKARFNYKVSNAE